MDGKAVICARIESNIPAGSKGAGWVHQLDKPLPILPQPRPVAKQIPKATPGMLDKAYRILLSELRLSQPHYESLTRRGLSDAEILNLGYKTLPVAGRRELLNVLQSVQLAGVPGFYLDAGYWRLAGPAGIAIPVKDTRGRIAGFQIRCDRAEGGKYKWLSSRGFNAGCSPGTPIHVAGKVSIGCEVWITEGPLKADIAALRLGRLVLAVAGVGNWSGVIPIIRELKPSRAIIAFDMDKSANPAVKLHSNALMTCLIRLKVRTFEADWNVEFKGLDNILCQR